MDEKLCNPVLNKQKLISDVPSGWSMHPKGIARVIAKLLLLGECQSEGWMLGGAWMNAWMGLCLGVQKKCYGWRNCWIWWFELFFFRSVVEL